MNNCMWSYPTMYIINSKIHIVNSVHVKIGFEHPINVFSVGRINSSRAEIIVEGCEFDQIKQNK